MYIDRNAIGKNLMIILVLLYSIMPAVPRFISTHLTTYFYMMILVFLAVAIVGTRRNDSLSWNIYILFPFAIWKVLEMTITSENFVMWGYQSLIALLPVILGIYILTYRKYEINFFGKLICLALIITVITTMLGLHQYPEAARWLAAVESSDSAQLILYEQKNIGGYDFVYTIVLLYPLIILAYKRKKLNPILVTIMTSGILIFLIYAEYTTALLFFLVTTTMFFMRRSFKERDVVMFAIVAIILCMIFSDEISQWLTWFADQLNSEIFSERLYALAGGTDGLAESESNRLELYMKSFNTFLNHPMLGTFLSGGYGSGGHSFILDMLAQFGLLGAVVLVYMYRRIFHLYYEKYRTEREYGYVLWTFVQAILLSVINTGMWLYVLTLYVPILLTLIYKRRES